MGKTISSFKYNIKEDSRCQSADKPLSPLLTETEELKTKLVPKSKFLKPQNQAETNSANHCRSMKGSVSKAGLYVPSKSGNLPEINSAKVISSFNMTNMQIKLRNTDDFNNIMAKEKLMSKRKELSFKNSIILKPIDPSLIKIKGSPQIGPDKSYRKAKHIVLS